MTLHPLAPPRIDDARTRLRAELSLLDLLLERHVLRLRAAHLLDESDFRGLYIADAQVDALLRSANRMPDESPGAAALTVRIEALRADASPGGMVPVPLSPFERELLVLAAAVDIDPRYPTLFAYAQNDVTRKLPTVALALQLLCDEGDERIEHRHALAPHAPLFRERLLRLTEESADAPLLAQSLRADPRVVDFLLGIDTLDPRLAACTRRLEPRVELRALHLDDGLRERIANLLPQLDGAPVIALEGVEGSGRKRIAEAIAADRGLRLTILDAAQPMPADALALLRREALLSGDAVVIDHCERITDPLPAFPAPLFLVTTENRHAGAFTIAVPIPGVANRKSIWIDALADIPASADVDAVSRKFALTPRQIHGAVSAARATAALRAPDQRALTTGDLHAGAQSQSSPGLRKLAARVELKFGWNDLVLPPRSIAQLRDVCRAIEYRPIVHGEWGLARRMNGTGVAVLFTGSSGTGKTMSASIVARELGLEMYRIDLSAVVNKYIGETEKNLERIFAEAQTSNAVLFFDEADALFGKRSEIKDAHDRYANIETAYLLQRMESYDGIVILATNLGRNIDEAFARRMFDTIEFPLPDAPHRERIWRGILGGAVPLAADVDAGFLARNFELSGGNIRNVVLAAAFSAAAAKTPVTMRALILATARELQKIGRLPSRDDFREFYEMVREGGG